MVVLIIWSETVYANAKMCECNAFKLEMQKKKQWVPQLLAK